jgi:hypothetical protein
MDGNKDYVAFIGGNVQKNLAEKVKGMVAIETGLGLPFSVNSALMDFNNDSAQEVYFIQLDASELKSTLKHQIRESRLDEFFVGPAGARYLTTVLPVEAINESQLNTLMNDALCRGIYRVLGFRSQPDMNYRSDGLVVSLKADSMDEAQRAVREVFSESQRLNIIERIQVC